MTTITSESSLASIVDAQPSLARVLERYGLDYCCGGRQSLAEACSDLGLDPVELVGDLTAANVGEPTAAWTTMSAAELTDHIESIHHRYLWAEMPRLSELADKVVAVHGANHPELVPIRACYEEIRADLQPHMMKEEQVLFPMIRELSAADAAPSFHCGSLQNPISVMMFEHERVGELLERMHELTGSYTPPPDACASYTALFAGLAELEADTRLHVHKENNVLFPAVIALEHASAAR